MTTPSRSISDQYYQNLPQAEALIIERAVSRQIDDAIQHHTNQKVVEYDVVYSIAAAALSTTNTFGPKTDLSNVTECIMEVIGTGLTTAPTGVVVVMQSLSFKDTVVGTDVWYTHPFSSTTSTTNPTSALTIPTGNSAQGFVIPAPLGDFVRFGMLAATAGVGTAMSIALKKKY